MLELQHVALTNAGNPPEIIRRVGLVFGRVDRQGGNRRSPVLGHIAIALDIPKVKHHEARLPPARLGAHAGPATQRLIAKHAPGIPTAVADHCRSSRKCQPSQMHVAVADPLPDIPGLQFARANATADAVSFEVCNVFRIDPRLYDRSGRPPCESLVGSASACEAITTSAVQRSERSTAARAGIAQMRGAPDLTAAADERCHVPGVSGSARGPGGLAGGRGLRVEQHR